MLKIALLGAPRTGKSLLESSLRSAMKSSALAVTVYGETDVAALPAALRDYDLVLLTGLPVSRHASKAGFLQRQAQQAADAAIRAALIDAQIAFQVLYGSSDERLTQAREAIESLLPAQTRPQPQRPPETKNPWVWLCDKCSDPQCEHRLLTDLLASRTR
jgi:nicotinamide riboside kinase